jgi:resuscitation-promoting factor RpfA
MRCPRCDREVLRPTAFCAGCGAPLLLGEERPPSPLDAPLDLDRRLRGPVESELTASGVAPPPLPAVRPPAPAPSAREPEPALAGAHSAELAALERSHWDLGRAPVPAEPTMVLAAARLPETVTRDPDGEPAEPDRDALPDPEVDALEVHVARAETWRRVAAWALDAVPFVAAGFALARRFVREAGAALAPPSGMDGLLDLLARERVIALSVTATVALALAVYATLAHALGGATLGKRLLRIRVVGPDGAPPSPARSTIRSAFALLSAALLGLGFVLALFTRTGRALHDFLARTWVVKAS